MLELDLGVSKKSAGRPVPEAFPAAVAADAAVGLPVPAAAAAVGAIAVLAGAALEAAGGLAARAFNRSTLCGQNSRAAIRFPLVWSARRGSNTKHTYGGTATAVNAAVATTDASTQSDLLLCILCAEAVVSTQLPPLSSHPGLTSGDSNKCNDYGMIPRNMTLLA